MRTRKIFLFVCLLFLIIFSANPFYQKPQTWPPAPTFYPKLPEDSPELVNADYDDFQKHQSFWKIFVPDWFGKIISSHVEVIHMAGCFERLCQEDLDHGHFIFRQNTELFHDSPEELLKKVTVVLYHTHEGSNNWQKQILAGVPLWKRMPRSLAGFLNGMVSPAINFVSLPPAQVETYVNRGTIDPFDVRNTLELFNREGDLRVMIKGSQFVPRTFFSIKPFPEGRYSVGGQRYDIFVWYDTVEQELNHKQ